jgi:hypothetical protein
MIKHLGRKWALYTSDGRRLLGLHATKAEAEKQERAIHLSKLRREGRIPPRVKPQRRPERRKAS